MSTQKPDEIASSTAANAYHVGDAKRDAIRLLPSALANERAAAIMVLATAVGITTIESRTLVAAKLEAWKREDDDKAHRAFIAHQTRIDDMTSRLEPLYVNDLSVAMTAFHRAYGKPATKLRLGRRQLAQLDDMVAGHRSGREALVSNGITIEEVDALSAFQTL